ncbi:ubiquinol oxidase subunit II [Rhizobium mayense]|uniref:Ubiquinol oxidase subunit 2 n=1 Tax=Rhizobium mayense TaxID=1312184 RepID=A0ABT7K4Y3_9HYPH|nr:ubiquinol oxidase subunit II [Rhizobium mayense]MDL2402473.1 ubiquinol oxidase subunit II [Rhizobium mayense]
MLPRERQLPSAPQGNADALRWLRLGGAFLLLLPLTACEHIELLNPKGDIAAQEKTLILVALGLMLLVVIPVMVLTVVFAWRYRASNTKATYAPTWAHSTSIEVVIWTIPCLIVTTLAVMIWETTHTLDPYKPLITKNQPVRVEVVALNWKWLFIYPDYGIASVNHLAIPVDTPIEFKLTAESMMNSFFIPQLGSQIYAMAGMRTQLHLIANEPGTYEGLSSAFSGPGFSDMHFDVAATNAEDFAGWIAKVKDSPLKLDAATYQTLEQPSIKNPVTVYAGVEPALFDTIVNRFMSGRMSEMAFATSDVCTAQTLPPIAWNKN